MTPLFQRESDSLGPFVPFVGVERCAQLEWERWRASVHLPFLLYCFEVLSSSARSLVLLTFSCPAAEYDRVQCVQAIVLFFLTFVADTPRMTSLTEGVRSTFEEHHNEIRRRSSVARTGEDLNASTFEHVENEGADDPFVNPEQRYVLYSLSQKEFAPCPRDETQPALCIYGTFQTNEEAHEHSAHVIKEHPSNSILLGHTHDWIVAHATLEHMKDADYGPAHAKRLLDGESAKREASTKEFHENVTTQRAGAVRDVTDEAADKHDIPVESNPHHKINTICRVADQRFAVVSFVKDESTPPEFLFRVYACYETESEANRYVRNVAGDHVRDFDIDVIKLCAWAFPQSMDGVHVQKEVYRSSELNAVMASHKKNPQEVEKFYRENENWKKEDETTTLALENAPDA